MPVRGPTAKRRPLISISPSPSITNRTVCRPSAEITGERRSATSRVELRLKQGALSGAHHRAVAQGTVRDQRRAGGREHIALSVELHDGLGARGDRAATCRFSALSGSSSR